MAQSSRNQKKSYIELEYEYAIERKKPLFSAVISDAYLAAKVKAVGASAIETSHGTLRDAFVETVTKKICRFFGDVNELKLIVFESLANFERNEGLAGWIRGGDVLDPKATLKELDRLQEENASLRKQIAELDVFLASTAKPGRSGQQGIGASLSEDAKVLLLAAKNSDGYIMYLRYMGGASVQAANQTFTHPENSPREEARWKAAIDLLLDQRLVETVGSKGETFRLTKLGYEVADKIEAANVDTQP